VAHKDLQAEADAQTLKAAGIQLSDDGILAYLRSLRPLPQATVQVKDLIARLGSDRYVEREKATQRLAALAAFARPDLEQASRSTDREVARRAKAILDDYEAEGTLRETAVLAALREIARRKSPGAVSVLLETPQIWQRHDFRQAADKALGAVARLADEETLWQTLLDHNDRLRLAAAVALLNRGDRRSLLTLVRLLESADLMVRNRASRVLRAVSGQDIGFGAYDAPEVRAKAAAAWRRWMDTEGRSARLTLPAPTETRLGRVLLCNSTRERIVELDENGKEVWETSYAGASCCQGLPDGHRLLGSRFGRVTEYDAAGKAVWHLDGLPDAVSIVRRLASGNTLVAIGTRRQAKLREFRPDKKFRWEVWLPRCRYCPQALQQLEDGNLRVTFAPSRRVVELNPEGMVVTAGDDWDDRVVFDPVTGEYIGDQLAWGQKDEVDGRGMLVWSHGIAYRTHTQRLPDGHSLIINDQKIVEMNAAGKVLWEYREHIMHFSAY
jgi:hypothetical protein